MTTNEKVFVIDTEAEPAPFKFDFDEMQKHVVAWTAKQYPIRLKALEDILMDMLQSEYDDESAHAQEIIHKYKAMTGDHYFADLFFRGRIQL